MYSRIYAKTKKGLYRHLGERKLKLGDAVIEQTILTDDHETYYVGKGAVLGINPNLEKLMDCFVQDNGGYSKPEILTLEQMKEIKAQLLSDYADFFYGAIWTEGEDGNPILKTVAKYDHSWRLRMMEPTDRKRRRK